MTFLEKLMATVLGLCIIATICVAISLTSVSASITLTFGKPVDTEYNHKVAVFAAALPIKALGGN
jgi:hypothetical protein